MKIEFWEQSYKVDDISAFGTKPNDTIVKYIGPLEKTASILDAGCGDGKNALYLAKSGFTAIDAFDISENAVSKLKRLAAKDHLNVNGWIQDLREFEFHKKYDVIFSLGTLHFVPEGDWKKFIAKAKANTNVGGIHIIQLFTNDLPPTEEIAEYAVGMANDGELRDLYTDWEILEFKSYVFSEEHPGVPYHSHSSNKIVAKKR